MRFAIALAIAAIGLGPNPAWGYCLKTFTGTSPYAKWQNYPVQYRVSANVTDANVLAAIDAAFATWGSVECTPLRFEKAGTFDLASTSFEHDNEAIYVFWYDAAAGFPANVDYVSYTFIGHDNTGRLKNASIAVNGFGYDWATDGAQTKLDVQNELVTMIGSVIGLRTSNSADSVMQNTINYGDTSKRTIKQDDIDALIFLYEGATCPVVTVPGANGCTGTAPAPDGGAVVPDGGSTTTDGGGTSGDGGVQPGQDSGTPYYDAGNEPQCRSKDDCAGDEVCTAEGICVKLSGCTTSAQCGDGKVCTAEGVCVAMDDSGCRLGGAEDNPLALLGVILLLLGGVGLRRRRRN